MFLGPDIPKKVPLELKEMVQDWVYSVHDSRNGEMYGYLIHMVTGYGIAGPDFKNFSSNEGYYVVGVVRNADSNPVDFIGLLGNQNMLPWYELDRLQGRVDVDDLCWFDKHVKKYEEACERGPSNYPNHVWDGSSSSGWLDPGAYIIIPTKYNTEDCLSNWRRNGYVSTCKCVTGVDSLGRQYSFPDKAFEIKEVKNPASLKRYRNYLIKAPKGAYYSVSGAGNVTIRFDLSEEKEREIWKYDDNVFRMLTDITSASYGYGDFSEYDADSNKTIAKYEAALKKAHEGYYKLPPKVPCCEECDKDPMHKRCLNELNEAWASMIWT